MVDPDILMLSQIRGTQVHASLSCFAKGLWQPPLPDEWQGYVNSGITWIEKYTKEIHLAEETLVDEGFGYKGTLDLIVTMVDGLLTIPDYKTARAKSKVWPVRMAAYRNLAIKNGYPIQKVGALRLREDGSPAIFDHYPIAESDFAVFHAALQAHRYFNS